jgi:hypothetical protein
MTTALKTEIKSLVRESVREALSSEFALMRTALQNQVSAAEQKDIEKRYKKPSRSGFRVIRARI